MLDSALAALTTAMDTIPEAAPAQQPSDPLLPRLEAIEMHLRILTEIATKSTTTSAYKSSCV